MCYVNVHSKHESLVHVMSDTYYFISSLACNRGDYYISYKNADLGSSEQCSLRPL